MSENEETVFFNVGRLRLEGRLWLASGPWATIITHPHPLYGGELDNPVVVALADAYQRLGYSTLRFNFRGVGASAGDYDDGRGERDDLRAAAAFLDAAGKTVTDLAGYSFGAWINLGLDPPLPAGVRRQLLVAPPLAYVGVSPGWWPRRAVRNCGWSPARATVSRSPDRAPRMQAPRWQETAAGLHLLPGADHFFSRGRAGAGWRRWSRPLLDVAAGTLTPPALVGSDLERGHDHLDLPQVQPALHGDAPCGCAATRSTSFSLYRRSACCPGRPLLG
jgi:alpha/beta superfamily hydrolase